MLERLLEVKPSGPDPRTISAKDQTGLYGIQILAFWIVTTVYSMYKIEHLIVASSQ